ncbi:MAG TPA: hypothetical protein VM143_17940 [Acidimicrobiales bacterium]|nr:hypothetical protein [Acidimicrobiales bacterium]
MVASTVALGLVTAACVHPGAPTVGMSKVEASLVFGLTDIAQPVETPIEAAVAELAAPPPADQEFQPPAPEPEKPFEFAKPVVPRFGPQAPTVTKPACPEAPITAAALVSPQPRITGDPRPGISKWRLNGYVTTRAADGTSARSEFDGPDNPRAIRNFKRTSPDLYSFEEVQVLNDRVTVTTYEVNNKPVTANPSDGVGIVVTPSVGEPERGIVLTKIEVVSKQNGQPIEKFEPVNGGGLLMLPLPATAGETFTSTAVDPKTGEVRSHQGTVTERQRIDACGDLVDGWGVQYKRRGAAATQAAGTVAAGSDIEFHTVYATQYGGVPILDYVKLTAAQCGAPCPLELTSRLGQLDPDPLTP